MSQKHIMKRRKIYADVRFGLGNRLRALISAKHVAQELDRDFVLIWQPDFHCEAKLTDLFKYNDAQLEESFINDISNDHDFDIYNYISIDGENGKANELITFDNRNKNKDIYFRSAYPMHSRFSNWNEERKVLRSLTVSDSVNGLINPYNLSGYTGVHIRLGQKTSTSVPEYEQTDGWPEEAVNDCIDARNKSHYSNFIKRIDYLIKENNDMKFFLASDSQITYEIFQSKYGDKVTYLNRDDYDRSRVQVIYALADAILLGQCKRLLGSPWSSFTELAIRYAPAYESVQISGEDF